MHTSGVKLSGLTFGSPYWHSPDRKPALSTGPPPADLLNHSDKSAPSTRATGQTD